MQGRSKRGRPGEEIVSDSTVEWSLVDYGTENFYIASYRRPDETPAAEVAPVDQPAREQGCRWSDCIPIFRCWEASRQARKAA